MPREWQPVVDGMSKVMKMVHLAIRRDTFDVEETRVELLRQRRAAYNDELTRQAAAVGCPGRRGILTNNSILSELNEMCQKDAESIANTFNYDVAGAIVAIRSDVPTANRHTYAARLRKWNVNRSDWKVPQITEYTDSSARSMAQRDFYRYNDAEGVAVLHPRSGVCPVCIGWIARKEVPLAVATANPPPYHPSCPHYFVTYPNVVAKSECPNLWMGA